MGPSSVRFYEALCYSGRFKKLRQSSNETMLCFVIVGFHFHATGTKCSFNARCLYAQGQGPFLFIIIFVYLGLCSRGSEIRSAV